MSWPKRILCLLALLTAALLFAAAVFQADIAQRIARNSAVDGYVALEVPNQGAAADADAFLPALRSAAEASSVNVFRKTGGWTADDRPHVAYYALIETETDFFDDFSLDGADDVASALRGETGWSIPAAGEDPEGEQVSIIRDLLANDSCSISSMELAFGSRAPSGTYYIEAKDDAAISAFAEQLEAHLSDAGGPIELSYTYGIGRGYDAGETLDPTAARLAALSAFMLLAMAAYCQLSDSRRHAVVVLNGGGPVCAWLQTGGALVCGLAAAATALAAACAALVPGSSPSFVALTGARVGAPLAAVAAASLLVSRATRPKSIPLALKGRENARGMAAACLAAKAVICALLIGAAASAAAETRILGEEQARYANWERTSGYALFFPLTVGDDAAALMSGPIAAAALDLYPAAVERGALYVDAARYTPMALQDGLDEFRSMVVNPNYLEEFPILDAGGDPVSIAESEKDWILLVPESRRADEEAIRDHWRSTRCPDEGDLEDMDLSIFGRTVDDPPSDQEVEIVWIEDGQEVFAFNPEVGADGDGCVVDPIVEVVTLSNSVGFDRANAVTGSLDGALKVKVEEGGVEATYEAYRPLLEELGVDDSLKQLASAEDAVFWLLQGFRDVQARLVLKMGALLVASAFLAVQSAALLFEVNARRAAVKRMYGYGFFGREWPTLAAFVAVWAAALSGALAFSGELMPEVLTADAQTAGLAVAVLVAVDAVAFLVALAAAERRRTADVLKGAK